LLHYRETYKGWNIVVEEPEDEARLAEAKPSISIDDQRVNIIQSPDGTYSSEGLYYTKYASLPELARAIIDSYPREDEPLSS
jgi:hypothetical protein